MNGVGASQIYAGSLGGPTLVRASNSIGYVLPKSLGNFYGQAQIYFGENNGTEAAPTGKKDGNGVSARIFAHTPKAVDTPESLIRSLESYCLRPLERAAA